ncbi:hypothetical protein MP638_005908 [Amoeboaphelidium occidentale]|nr:hypothetical protein MP638_005908 [Amoeboaphelidium occidentale]
MPLEVIGAGFGRTGTFSLKVALEKLGYPCYHMYEVAQNNDMDKWIEFAQSGSPDGYDFEKIFTPSDGRKPYTAGVDHPVTSYYKHFMKLYPEAKIILTVRDSPEVWYESAKETIHEIESVLRSFFMQLTPFGYKFGKVTSLTTWDNPEMFNGEFNERGIEIYNERVEEVKRIVPKDKLLVFNVKEGWEPLCKFLGKPVPNEPFPRVNERDEFKRMIRGMALVSAVGTCTMVLGACGVLAYVFKKLIK